MFQPFLPTLLPPGTCLACSALMKEEGSKSRDTRWGLVSYTPPNNGNILVPSWYISEWFKYRALQHKMIPMQRNLSSMTFPFPCSDLSVSLVDFSPTLETSFSGFFPTKWDTPWKINNLEPPTWRSGRWFFLFGKGWFLGSGRSFSGVYLQDKVEVSSCKRARMIRRLLTRQLQ